MGLTTRVSAHGEALADGLRGLAHGRADVVVVEPADPEPADPATSAADRGARRRRRRRPGDAPRPRRPTRRRCEPASRVVEPGRAPTAPTSRRETDDTHDDRAARRSLLGGIGHDRVPGRQGPQPRRRRRRTHGRPVRGRRRTTTTPTSAERPVAPAGPVRRTPAGRPGRALRAQVTRRHPGDRARQRRAAPRPVRRRRPSPHPAARGRASCAAGQRRPGVRGGAVRSAFDVRPGPPDLHARRRRSTPLVIDDFVTEPAYDPVIGPELAAARTRVGLSVDELAERTRIRPHVIESIEVDDFAPCGGDFYARGHLRTLARVLGKDPAPLLEQFDDRYATAPINARRVFEAELATGMTGSMRSTVGGPNWALLVGVVLALVMTWGVVRLFAARAAGAAAAPDARCSTARPASTRRRSTGRAAAPAPTAKPIRVTLVGAQAGSQGRRAATGAGEVVWAGEIVLGEKRTVEARPAGEGQGPGRRRPRGAGSTARTRARSASSASPAAARSTAPPPADPRDLAARPHDPPRLAQHAVSHQSRRVGGSSGAR